MLQNGRLQDRKLKYEMLHDGRLEDESYWMEGYRMKIYVEVG
jgi:hypothetical protein